MNVAIKPRLNRGVRQRPWQRAPAKVVNLVMTLYAFLVSIGLIGKAFKLVSGGFVDTLIGDACNPLIGLFVRILATSVVQSSSTTTSLAVPLAGAGILTLHQIFPYALGANVGTTITAILAAFAVGEISALTVAFAHLLFNVIGIIVIWPIPVIRGMPIFLAEQMAKASNRSRLVPLVYVVTMFYLIPPVAILLLR